MRLGILALAGMMTASAVHADGDALVIGNTRYDAMQRLFGAARVVAAADALRNAGLEVSETSDASTAEMRATFRTFVKGLEPGDAPVVVLLAGAFVHGAGGAYLLPVDDQTGVDTGRVLTGSLPLDAVLSILAQSPGRAFLVLGESAPEEDLGPYLSPGIGELDIPQGVTVVRGPAPDVARFAARDLARSGRSVAASARAFELDVTGFVTPDLTVLTDSNTAAATAPAPAQPAAPAPAPAANNNAVQDRKDWDAALKGDSVEAYQAYLQAHPNGRFAGAANQRIAAIEAEPGYQARRAEEDLNLTRDDRRDIQRDLSILGYNTRGIDGIFGRGTRGAIARWQEAIGREKTGYLTRSQITRLDGQAERRAAELEAEAEARRKAQLEEDRAFWQQVEGRGDEEGLRSYLETYPEGLFADKATELLAAVEAARANQAATADRRAWEQARGQDSVEGYQQYLQIRPGGSFANEAKARIRQLTRDANDARAAARAREEEAALNLAPVARRLAEARLDKLGLEPGPVDGQFDRQTRRAIRAYQRARGLTVSGYLDEKTVVRLLADGILGR